MDVPQRSVGRVIRFGVFAVDLGAGELFKRGIKIRLQQQPFRVLALLLEHPGEVVTREDLRQAIWPAGTFVEFDLGLAAAIHKVRIALGDSAEHPRLVETLPRRGYRFIAAVEGVVASEAEQGVPPPEAHAPTSRQSRVRLAVALGLSVLVVGYVVAARSDLLHPARPAASAQSVAVLPFVNLSGDTAYEYFSDGMTEELIDALVQVPGLQVPARSSAFVFKGKSGDIREIGRRLNVANVVEGSVRRSGTRLRVAAQLIKVADGYHLWSAVYERELRDVFAVQDEITRAIVQALQLKLAPAAAAASRPENLEAYQLYLKGRLFWNKATEEGLNRAREFFSAAIAQDSGYARAYAGLADVYDQLLSARYLPRAEAYPQARAAADRAVALDSQLAEAYTSRGQIRWRHEWDRSGAEQDFRRAVVLNPGYALGHLWYGRVLVTQGRSTEGIREASRAVALDPLSAQVLLNYSFLLFHARRYGPAVEQARKALELEPTSVFGHQRLAEAYLFQDRLADAIREFQAARHLLGGRGKDAFIMAKLGYTYARAGRRAEALKMLNQMKSLATNDDSVPGGYEFSLAQLYAGLGEQDQAFAWLERAYQEHEESLNGLRVSPFFDPLRSDPRFTQLLKKVGLEE